MEYVVFGVMCVMFIGVRLVMSWSRLRGQLDLERPARQLARRGRRLDASSLDDVPESSVVRVVGEVKRLDRWVVAPMTNRACAYWRLEVSVLEYSAVERRTYWRTLFDRTDGLPFVLASERGECCVEPSSATVAVERARITEIVSSRKLSPKFADLLENGGVSVASLRWTKVRFQESIVPFGARVAVVGAGRMVARSSVDDMATGYRDRRPTWLCLSGTDDDLLVSDDRKLLAPRGTGGGIKTEPPRGRGTHEPSQTDTWAALDVDEFESRITAKRRRRNIALVAAAILGTAVAGVALISHRDAPQAAPVADPCDLSPLINDYTMRGAKATRDRFAFFDEHCSSSVPYRRLHFDAQRKLGNVHAAAADAEQLLANEPARADLWLALAADRHRVDLVRQAVALSTTDAERNEAAGIIRRIDLIDQNGRCDDAFARHEVAAGDIPADCATVGRGNAILSLDSSAPAQLGQHLARATIDLGVGTTIVSHEVAARAALAERSETGMTVFRGRIVHGNFALAPSLAVGATRTTNLPVLVADLPDGNDIIVGLDYLWRFSRVSRADAIELSERRESTSTTEVPPREVQLVRRTSEQLRQSPSKNRRAASLEDGEYSDLLTGEGERPPEKNDLGQPRADISKPSSRDAGAR